MADDAELELDCRIPASDSRGPDGGQDESAHGTRWQLEHVALTIARLIRGRIARERFAALNAANDNRPEDAQGAENGAGRGAAST